MEKLIFIGLFIFSVKCFSMDGIEAILNPKSQKIEFLKCYIDVDGDDNLGFYLEIDEVPRTDCVGRFPKRDWDKPYSVSTDRIAFLKGEVANAEALDQKIKIFFPADPEEELTITRIDDVKAELKKCEADRDLYKKIAQIMSTNGAGKTEAGIDAVADYLSSSASNSDAKGE